MCTALKPFSVVAGESESLVCSECCAKHTDVWLLVDETGSSA